MTEAHVVLEEGKVFPHCLLLNIAVFVLFIYFVTYYLIQDSRVYCRMYDCYTVQRNLYSVNPPSKL